MNGLRARAQRGTALLLAMVILSLVATVAAAMVWQQERAIRVEAAERARAQAGWILIGALDWARLLLQEDMRTSRSDHLGEPWAVPLAEARLSTFLAADRDPTAEDGIEAFLSGRIEDLQSRFNLYDVIDDKGEVDAAGLATLRRLCDLAGLPTDTAERLAVGLAAASADPEAGQGQSDPPLLPQRFDQLPWLGISADTLAPLARYVTLLPESTPINVNTASREVIAAAIEGLDLGTAERLVQTRQRQPFARLQDVQRELPTGVTINAKQVGVSSKYFEVVGRLRLDDRVIEQHSVVQRQGNGRAGQVATLWSERRSAVEESP